MVDPQAGDRQVHDEKTTSCGARKQSTQAGECGGEAAHCQRDIEAYLKWLL